MVQAEAIDTRVSGQPSSFLAYILLYRRSNTILQVVASALHSTVPLVLSWITIPTTSHP